MKDIVYANNEREIKKYNYATIKTKGNVKGETKKNLIITNKRIINESISEKYVVRNEIPISSVEFINSNFSTQNKGLFGAIALIVLGIIIAIVSKILVGSNIPMFIGLAICLLGIILLLVSLFSARESVTLTFSGRKNKHNILSLGSSNIKNNKITTKKIKVDREIACKMVEEIGAILINING